MTTDDFLFSNDMPPSAAGGAPWRQGGQPGLPLIRRDILAYEKVLRDDVASVIPFEAHALYFPMEDEITAPEWIPDEAKLLLPLRYHGTLLGVLLLRNPLAEAVERVLALLPSIVTLCLDKISLYKWGRTEPLTGLATKAVLLEKLADEMTRMREAFASGAESSSHVSLENTDKGEGLGNSGSPSSRPPSTYHGTLGIIVLRLSHLRAIARSHGHHTSEKLMRALGAALRDLMPEQGIGARTGDEEFAILLPGAVQHTLEELARTCVFKLNGVSLISRLTGTPVRIQVHAGYTLFPQDWEARHEGREGRDIMAEAESLFDKARLAGFRAGEMGQSGSGVLGYGSILPKGGIIAKVLPLSRVRTTLGRDVGAREGQRFTVWAMNYPLAEGENAEASGPLEPIYKGEIVLADVREDTSQADVLLLGDPAWSLEPGDRLNLVEEDYGTAMGESDRPGRPDPLTGLYRHGDFLAKLAVARERVPSFGLALVRFQLPGPEHSGQTADGLWDVEHSMAEAAALVRHLLEGRANYSLGKEEQATERTGKWPYEEDGSYLLAGRYSLNSLLLFHPGLAAADAPALYEPLSRELGARLGVSVAIGIACLPWLTYRAGDALECCRKALEYALLLPPPHVGVFDSLAINISADKVYSQGDVFGAIEEYRLALLADENNTLAWNSLGVCLAGVGRHGEARRAFEQAMRRDLRDAAIHYNLGTACVNTGDYTEARRQFRICLDLEPGYAFADIKLGELAEQQRDMDTARKHYEDAQKSDPTSPVPYRCLARLDLQADNHDKARERLHQALLRNPQDAFSLHMMARLYLDGGEDPELAETLARQSVALRPDRKAAWLELARALEAQGRHRDARDARVRAGEL